MTERTADGRRSGERGEREGSAKRRKRGKREEKERAREGSSERNGLP